MINAKLSPGRKKPEPRNHKIVLQVQLNEGMTQQELIDHFQMWMDKWLDDVTPRRTGRLINSIIVTAN